MTRRRGPALKNGRLFAIRSRLCYNIQDAMPKYDAIYVLPPWGYFRGGGA